MKSKLTARVVFPVLLLGVNLAIAWKLLSLEYSANLASNEGQFIAIAREVADHPQDMLWWPLWDCGLPFQNTYLPLLQLITGVFSRITGHSPALSFHQVSAAAFCLGPVFLYYLAWTVSRLSGTSFFVALAYSVLSPCTALAVIRQDTGGLWNLRRLQILGFYGEGPHTLTVMFLPLAILFLYLALSRDSLWPRILAGVFVALTVLANAFGAVILMLAGAALMAVYGMERVWRNTILALAIGTLAYLWISPLMPPSVVAAIRLNSATVDGDYRFTTRSLGGVAALAAGFLLLWAATRGMKWLPHLRFSVLFAWLTTGVVVLGVVAQVYVVPQPHRYQIAMDMSLCLAAVFGGAELVRRFPARVRTGTVVVLAVLLAVQTRHAIRYARGLIRGVDITSTEPYRLARWMEANMHGARVMVSGSYSFYFNNFTDTPQLHGGQDPMLPSLLMRIAVFTIYSGMNAGARDGEISVLWLKALGAHAIAVPGPRSAEYYKPIANPRKFDPLLPVLWREGDDTIYSVPARTTSLAHVMAPGALVRDQPENGLDTAQIERYVKALEDPSYPEAGWRWNDRHSATIHAQIGADQVVSTQITYHPGWHAAVNGAPQQTFADGLGFLVVKPACQGACELSLWYDGGIEWRATRLASGSVMLLAAALGVVSRRRRVLR